MAEQDIRISITGDSDELVASANKAAEALNDMGKDAAGAGKAIDTALDDAAPSADAASKSVSGLSSATADLKSEAGETASVFGKLKSAVGLVSPEAEALLDGVQRLADGVEGTAQGAGLLGGSLGGLIPVIAGAALVAGTAAAAYAVLENESQRNANSAENLAIEIGRLDDVLRDAEMDVRALDQSWSSFIKTTENTERALRVLRGELTQLDADIEASSDAVVEATSDRIRAQGEAAEVARQQREEALKLVVVQEAEVARQEKLLAGLDMASDAYARRAGVLVDAQKELAKAEKQLDGALAAEARLNKELDESVERRNDEIRAQKELLELRDEETKRRQQEAESVKRVNKERKESAKILASLDEQFAQLGESQQETRERQRLEQLDAFEETLRKEKELTEENLAEIEALRADARQERMEADEAEAKAAADRAAKVAEARVRAEERADAEIQAARREGVDMAVSLGNDLLDFYEQQGGEQTEEERKRSERIFKVRKALALASIAIDTARGVMDALGQGQVGKAVVVALAGVASFATVASQGLDNASSPSSSASSIADSSSGEGPDLSISRPTSDGSGPSDNIPRVIIDRASAEYLAQLNSINPLSARNVFGTSNLLSQVGQRGDGFGARITRALSGRASSRPGLR